MARSRQEVEGDCLLLLEVAHEEHGDAVLGAIGFAPSANRSLVLLRQYQKFQTERINGTRADEPPDHVAIAEAFLADLERRLHAAVNQLGETTNQGRWYAKRKSFAETGGNGHGAGKRNKPMKRGRRK